MNQLKFHRAVVAIAMMLIGWLPSLAHDFEVDGIFYNKTSGNTVAVTYKGNSFSSYYDEYVGNVVIPSSVDYNGTTYSVTSIENEAFYSCSSLTDVVIGNSVTSIGNYAFYDCSSMTSIEIPNSVTSIGNYAFYECTSLTSIEIPNSVTSIGEGALWFCIGLTDIEIPNSVTSIGRYAFSYCTSLRSIVIPNSVTSIGDFVFHNCTALTSVVWNIKKCSDFSGSWESPFGNSQNITTFTFGDSVEYIPAYLCYSMSKLTDIVIPNSITSIGDNAFRGCTGLISIEIPNSVTSIGRYAFSDCTSLNSIEIPNSVTSIGERAFSNCTALTSVVWNVKKCYDFADLWNRPFRDSPNITSFTLGDSVEHIPTYLCYEMLGLTNLEIPNSVISIGESAFGNVEKLTIVTLGNSVTSIRKDAFKGCGNIKKIECKATKVPTIENEDQFSEDVYAKADLFVPIGYEDNYKYAYAWSEFHNIKGKEFSGIENVSLTSFSVAVDVNNIIVCDAMIGSQVSIYSVNGQLVALKTIVDNKTIITPPTKGVYIVVVDGKSFKVMVK